MSGDPLPAWHLDTVDGEAMRLWSVLLRDDNPIHVDPAAAAALGFGPRTVNPGPINLAYALNMLMAGRPGDYPTSVEARFHGNVVAGDKVEVTGTSDGDDDDVCQAEVRVGLDRTLAVDIRVRMIPLDDTR